MSSKERCPYRCTFKRNHPKKKFKEVKCTLEKGHTENYHQHDDHNGNLYTWSLGFSKRGLRRGRPMTTKTLCLAQAQLNYSTIQKEIRCDSEKGHEGDHQCRDEYGGHYAWINLDVENDQ